jgi:hypothetical protein
LEGSVALDDKQPLATSARTTTTDSDGMRMADGVGMLR